MPVLELADVSADLECSLCGRSKAGRRVYRSLGADEAFLIEKCECPSLLVISSWIDESFMLASDVCPPSGEPASASSESVCLSEADHVRVSASNCDKVSTEVELRLAGRLSRLLFASSSSWESVTWTELGKPCMMDIDSRHISGRLRQRSHEGDAEAKATLVSVQICPGVLYCESIEAKVSAGKSGGRVCSSSQSYRVRVVERTKQLGDWLCRARLYHPDNQFSCEFEWRPSDGCNSSTPADDDILGVIGLLHTYCACPRSMTQVLRRSVTDLLRQVARPTRDVRKPPASDNVYRVKIDGEHTWLIDGGCLWYSCRNNSALTVTGFHVKSYVARLCEVPDVIRAEQLTDGRLVFIDVLAANGSVVPVTNAHDSSMSLLFRSIREPPSLIIREDFSTITEAQLSRLTCGLPSDGIIVIDKASSLTFRIKQPTVDLMADNGWLVSRPASRLGGRVNQPSMHKFFPAESGMINGRIYECKLALDSTGCAMIESFSQRCDKEVPNFYEIVRDCLAILSSTDSEDLSLTSRVSNFSFVIRDAVYQSALNSRCRGKLVIDIGSGRLQSASIFSMHSDDAFFMCDPQLVIPRSRQDVQFYDVTNSDAGQLLECLTLMQRGKIKRVLYRKSAEELFSNAEVYDYVRVQRVPLVYSFSLSHLVPLYRRLFSDGFSQIGCCYVYDKADQDGTVFCLSGAKMSLAAGDGRLGVMKLPGKEPIVEPAVTLSDVLADESSLVSVRLAAEFAELEEDVKQILGNVAIVQRF